MFVDLSLTERAWLKGKTSGDLDDTRLVENIVGEAGVFKRRGEQAPRAFAPQERPKRLLLCVDVSASMYRFNTQDQRLARLQALVVMLMEALDGEELGRKYHYSVVGHSGDDCENVVCCFVGVFIYIYFGLQRRDSAGSRVRSAAQDGQGAPGARQEDGGPFRVLFQRRQVGRAKKKREVVVLIRSCSSLAALRAGIKKVAETEADDYFCLLVSDANLSRYGVDPAEFGAELTRVPEVNAFALFIARYREGKQKLCVLTLLQL